MQSLCFWALRLFSKTRQTCQRLSDSQRYFELYEVKPDNDYFRDNAMEAMDEVDAKLLIKYFDATEEGRLFYTE
jgi:hypothetical protein